MIFRDDGTRWQGTQLGYDKLLLEPDSLRDCCYCLTDPQAQALLAVIDAFRYTTRWYFSTELDREKVNNFVNDIQRRLMTPCGCEDTGIIFAYDSDGVLTQSNDGGVTYTPVPQKDPRNNSPLFPPPMGEDPDKCPAADGAVAAIIGDVFNNLLPEMSRADMEELLTTWVLTYINTSNPFTALVTVITNLIIGLGVEAIIASLTTDVWEKLRCCFFDNMLDDFSFDTDAWESLRECVLSEIGGIAGIFLEHLLFLAGKAGCTNLIRSGLGLPDAECDCTDDCADNWSIFNDIVPGHYHGEILEVGAGFIVAQAGPVTGGNHYLMLRTPDAASCCVVPLIEVTEGSFAGGLTGWTDCGVEPSEGAPQHTGLFGDAVCINYLHLQAPQAFTMKITFADCP